VNKVQLVSRSPAETRDLAARLGAHLAPGDTVALRGELGAGKTEFVRGLALGLGVPGEMVASPSFALAYEYQGRLTLVHLDLYRLPEVSPEILPDLEEYLGGPQVTAVEWAERLGNLLPPDYLEVLLVITGEEERQISLTGHGPRGEQLLALAAAELGNGPAGARKNQ
jgi:tRNA threonylcarbamoyladenosine biosynthesis protein TsaE